MKGKTPYKELLLLACLAIAVLAKGATPPAIDTLDEVTVPGTRERERERGWLKEPDYKGYYLYLSRRESGTRFQVTMQDIRELQLTFRRRSNARRLVPQPVNHSIPASAVKLEGDHLVGFDTMTTSAVLAIDDNVDEADGIPASLEFGPHAALVNLDYLRIMDPRFETHTTVVNGIDPQTRRCEEKFALLDDGGSSSNRFMLVADSISSCRRIGRAREDDLLFAEGMPGKLRQAVKDIYGPVAVRFSNKLGSEPGLIFVAWLPDAPHRGVRFERSWNRTSLLLFDGASWREEDLSARQRDLLTTTFMTEQVQRRFRQADRPGPLTESAAAYLSILANAEHGHRTSQVIADLLPTWIADCSRSLDGRAGTAPSGANMPGGACGLLVQFVYDAVARSRSGGRETIYDAWRPLLNASFRRGQSGASVSDFLASSGAARRIVRGLLDGAVDWNQFASTLDGIGVRIELHREERGPTVSAVELANFRD